MRHIYLTICGCNVTLATADAVAHQLIEAVFGAMQGEPIASAPTIRLTISVDVHTGDYCVRGEASGDVRCSDHYDLIYHLDKELILALQHRQAHLLFIHAGAVERHGQAILLAAASGTGKSTLTYALLEDGFRYLSDELAPIEIESLQVAAYPHALCMKTAPPAPYRLPDDIVRTRHTLHIPVAQLPSATLLTPQRLRLILLIHRGDTTTGISRRLSAAEAATRLYVNSLNALAHAGEGLDAILDITRQVPCYELNSSNLTTMAGTIDQLLTDQQ